MDSSSSVFLLRVQNLRELRAELEALVLLVAEHADGHVDVLVRLALKLQRIEADLGAGLVDILVGRFPPFDLRVAVGLQGWIPVKVDCDGFEEVAQPRSLGLLLAVLAFNLVLRFFQ